MTPTVGRIIHVKYSEYDIGSTCRAAIVTGIDYHDGKTVMHVATFRKRGDMDPAVVTNEQSWHDPRECPYVGDPS